MIILQINLNCVTIFKLKGYPPVGLYHTVRVAFGAFDLQCKRHMLQQAILVLQIKVAGVTADELTARIEEAVAEVRTRPRG